MIVANIPGSPRHNQAQRPAGTRFRTDAAGASRPAPSAARGRSAVGTRFSRAAQQPVSARPVRSGSGSPYSRGGARPPRKSSPIPVIIGVLIAIGIVAGAAVFVFPRLFGGPSSTVEAGQQVTLTIPEGSSGDSFASILSENHVIEDPSDYYAAVKKLNAEMSLKPGDYQFTTLQDPVQVVKQLVAGPNVQGVIKPGDYQFTTLQDPVQVVKQLVAGPNVQGVKLTVPEGKTVAQTAQIVEDVYGIPTADFIAQAKASSYVADYPFLSEAAGDSLEGFLYPKTYSFSGTPTADQVIRAMLDQYRADVIDALDFSSGRSAINAAYGLDLSDYDVLILASVVEREGLHAEQRAHVASVFLNRLAGKGDFAGRPYLESDATLMYETGGAVTAEDIKNIDSPYNSYKNGGLPPTPICSPSAEAIRATLDPTDSDDLYFYITQDEEYFSQTYDEHMQSWE